MVSDERIQRLNWLIRGWVNYFKLASMQVKLRKLDEWLKKRGYISLVDYYKLQRIITEPPLRNPYVRWYFGKAQ
jgi:hypothetical protein